MNKTMAVSAALALVLSAPLVGCGSSSTSTEGGSGSAAVSSSSSDFSAAKFYAGKWRGAVEVSGTSVYGTTSGSEPMLDVNVEEDGTFTIEPLEAHEDLLTTDGTWEGTDSELTLTTADGKQIKLTVVDDTTLSGNPSDFGIDSFDAITFVLY